MVPARAAGLAGVDARRRLRHSRRQRLRRYARRLRPSRRRARARGWPTAVKPQPGQLHLPSPGCPVQLPETVLRNIALEAVRLGNYYADDQDEVLLYIAKVHAELLADTSWLKKRPKLKSDNGLTKLYTVQEILAKKHEADGYNVFVDPDEAVAVVEAEHNNSTRSGPMELAPGALAELQDGLITALAAVQSSGDPVGDDELVEILEGCAAAGELGAAVWCGEQLEALHKGAPPEPLLNRAFDALKRLLRPCLVRTRPQLEGPWLEPSHSPKRHFGKLLQRLAQARKAAEVAKGGAAAERAERVVQGEKVLRKLCKWLAPALASDPEACACTRRGPLSQVVVHLCSKQDLEVSPALAYHAVAELEQSGAIWARGRMIEVAAPAAGKRGRSAAAGGEPRPLRVSPQELGLLEGLAKERLERRKRRRESRDKGRAAKRWRGAD